MSTTHYGQGFAIRKGQPYTVPDRADIERRAAKREAEEREARLESLAETEERERRTLALAVAEQAKTLEYRRLGGTQHLPPLEWGPEWDPDDDPFVGVDGNGPTRRSA